MKTVNIWLATSILLLTVGTVAAGIVMDVTPIDPTISPGETATYKVNVSYFMNDPPTEHVILSIDNPISGWTYTFDPNGYDIGTDESRYSTLSITAPDTAPLGTYTHTVNATASGEIIIIPLPFPIAITEIVTENVETELIPEFSTIAVPVVAVIGLLLLMRRRKE